MNSEIQYYKGRGYSTEIELKFLTEYSGGSRISPRRGRQLSRGREPTYDFAKFSKKLHEIERFGPPGASKILLCRSATAIALFSPKLCELHPLVRYSEVGFLRVTFNIVIMKVPQKDVITSKRSRL